MTGQKVLVIAEAGVNHNGSFDLAKRMVESAKSFGADYVKFQMFKSTMLVRNGTPAAPYQHKRTFDNGARLKQDEMLRGLELSEEIYSELYQFSSQVGIQCFATAFDYYSLEFLYSLGQRIFKVPSGEITNIPLLRRIAEFECPIILSTGMSDVDEIAIAISTLKNSNFDLSNLVLLHCTSAYPTPIEDVNLLAVNSLREKFGLSVGYSDHTASNAVSLAAVAMGARIIEKHFTLDKNMQGPDHAASIEPKEFGELIQNIRTIELALGDGKKRLMPSEMENIDLVRKSIVAGEQILKGEVFSLKNLTTKRPAAGISPLFWDTILGRKAKRNYQVDDYIVDE